MKHIILDMRSTDSKEKRPLVTIITTTYNSNPEYLKEAIDSVLIQTYPKIEYIITDDGSIDFPEEWIRNYLNEHAPAGMSWKIIKHPENIGTVKNLNYAIHKSHGKYIFGLAHDDVLYNNNVITTYVYKFLESDFSVLTSYREDWDESLTKYIRTSPTSEQVNLIKLYSGKIILYRIYCSSNKLEIPGGGCLADSRDCIIRNRLFDEKYRLVDDFPSINTLLWNRESIGFVDVINHKHREGGVSSNKSPNIIVLKDSMNTIKERLNRGKIGIFAMLYNYNMYIRFFASWKYYIIEKKQERNEKTFLYDKCFKELVLLYRHILRGCQRIIRRIPHKTRNTQT